MSNAHHPDDDRPVVRLSGITRTFGVESVGIIDVSLDIYPGEFLALVGASGAGKSTLLNILGLLDEPASGSYSIDGVDPFELSERARDRLRSTTFGFVFQNSFVMGDSPTIENVALPLRHRNVPGGIRDNAAIAALESFHLGAAAGRTAKLLSGGERQRLAIARAMVGKPRIVLADEPTGSLDGANARKVINLLRGLSEAGVTVVLITHDEELALAADRRVRLVNGRLIDSEATRRNRPGTPACRPTSFPRASRTRRLVDDLSDASASVHRHAKRSGLILASFALGIAGLIAAVGASESAASEVNSRLSSAQGNEIRIAVPDGAAALSQNTRELDGWITRLRQLPYVLSAGYLARPGSDSLRLRSMQNEGESTLRLDVISASYDFLAEASSPVSLRGADLSLLDERKATGIAWVGKEARRALKLGSPGPGSALWVNGRRIDVVGELSFDVSPEFERGVFVSRDVLAATSDVELTVVIRTEKGYAEAIAKAAPIAMDPVRPGRFTVETTSDLLRLRAGVADDFGTLIGTLSAILVALSALMASTTMSLAVNNRKPEIALRRAIGASRGCIARIFLYEGAIVGLVGGIAGAALGTVSIMTFSANQGWQPIVPLGLGPVGVLIGAVTGVVSALVPAWLASRLRPAEAIRG